MKTLFLSISDEASVARTMPSYCIDVETTTLVVKNLINELPQTSFFQIKHQQINTLFDLIDCPPFELLYFDDKKALTGKSFSIQNTKAPFLVQTQARFVALIPLGLKYIHIQKYGIQKEEGNFALSTTFLPTEEPYANEIAAWTLSLFALSNEELIERFNKEIDNKGWVTARGYYLDCLKTEIRNRPFNSDIVFDFDASGNVVAFNLGHKVALVDNKLQAIKI
ncbi:hypothetical protein L1S34_04255 [Flavobacterium sp. K77]|uniref:hypothetical protein n=1 Tax=Flavobacterium sp. K77 TaxID=2910676 RepID=UPI001F445222|nr:hypothetical protein [Flavobacterium sp. K77]MCF6140490.1 hypothetical protein [Flavobacterium sp. K77]